MVADIIHKRLEVRSHAFHDWRTQSLRESYEALPEGWLRNELRTILAIRTPARLCAANGFRSRA
jgi:hypothetical protein